MGVHRLGSLLLLASLSVGTGCLDDEAKHRFYGNAYAQRGEHAKAVREYEAAIRSDPDDVAALTLLGHSLFELGKLPQAERRYRRALKLDAGFGDAHFGLA